MNSYVFSIGLTLAVIIAAVVLIWLGWRNRIRRQSQVPAPYENFEDVELHRFEGMYVCTTGGEDWLDRIAVHGLGVRGNADLVIGERGVHFMRGGNDVHIPYSALTRLKRASGMAGKFVEKDGLVVVGWAKDEAEFDTGFRARYHTDIAKIYQLLASQIDDEAEQETN